MDSSTDALNPQEFRRQAHMIVDFLADYYENIEKYPVLSQVEPGYLQERLPKSAPNRPEPIETIMQDVQKHIIPGLTHWQSPNFFAYFPASASIAGFLGEMLSTGFNVVGFSWIASPASTELECIVTDWLGQMLELPKSFLFSGGGGGGGVLQGTTCEAVLCVLAAARDKKLREIGGENIGKLVAYASDQTHSAFQKACQIAGIRPDYQIRCVKTTKADSFQLNPKALRDAISSDVKAGLVPFFLCASLGTTASNAVDPLKPLCDLAKDFGIWVHVDAAYAGSACICPEFRRFLDGVEGADSLSLNAHKWFFANLDCCCLWVKDPTALTKALSTYPEFLRNKVSDSNKVVDYKDWQIALSRRFRALKLWIVLRSYGVANLQSFIRSHVKMAKAFEAMVKKDANFEVVVPRNFSMVCFRISPSVIAFSHPIIEGNNEVANAINSELLESINSSGKIYMTHGAVEGVYFLRFAVGTTLTSHHHVSMAWNIVQKHANEILQRKRKEKLSNVTVNIPDRQLCVASQTCQL